jgi:hypothetical protein
MDAYLYKYSQKGLDTTDKCMSRKRQSEFGSWPARSVGLTTFRPQSNHDPFHNSPGGTVAQLFYLYCNCVPRYRGRMKSPLLGEDSMPFAYRDTCSAGPYLLRPPGPLWPQRDTSTFVLFQSVTSTSTITHCQRFRRLQDKGTPQISCIA